MPSITLDKKPEGTPAIQPPMGELLALLRGNGFPVTTDDYVSLLKIVEHFGDEGLDSLAAHICPIIATTPEEQDRFYNVFDSYKRSQLIVAASAKKQRKWPWMLILGGLLLLAIVVLREECRRPGRGPASVSAIGLPVGNRDTARIAVGDYYAADLLQSGMFAGRERDTAFVTIRWEEPGRGRIGDGLRLHHRFAEPGLHLVRRSISSSRVPLGRVADTLAIYVCSGLQRISIREPSGPVLAGQPLLFSAESEQAGSATVGALQWDLETPSGQPISIRTDTPGLRHTFDTAGIYTLRCTPLSTGPEPGCVQGDTISIRVVDDNKLYGLSFAADGSPIQLSTSLKWWPGLLVLLLASGIAAWGFRRMKPKAKKPAPIEEPETSVRRGPPYEVPFSPVDPAGIILDKPLRRFLQQLRYKVEEECTELHVGKTIGATIRAGGLTELVYAPRVKPREYLVFIDNTAPQGMLVQLYHLLVDSLEAGGVPLLRFLYDRDLTCYNAENPAGVSLRSLADNYPAALPLILGDGDAILDKIAPAVKPALLHEFLRWETAVLITPHPFGSWGPKESLLAKHFLMAPVDSLALEALGQDLRNGVAPNGLRHRGYPAGEEPGPLSDIASLKAYLRDDTPLFQWICALCIYPKPRWELLIAFGRIILSRYGRGMDLRFDVLLHLCRIPWLRDGSFPQRLRMDLLKALDVDNEVAVRMELSRLMDELGKRYAGDHLFSAEKSLQDTINGFVLFANDPVRHSDYEAKADRFGELLRAGKVTDVPARKYLDGAEDGQWSTPLQRGGKSIAASDLVEERDRARLAAVQEADQQFRKQRRRRRLTAAGALIFLAALWSALFFGHVGRSDPRLGALYSAKPNQIVQLSFQVVKDYRLCADSSTAFSVLPGTIYVANTPYPLQFDSIGQRLSAAIPYVALQESDMKASLMLGAGSTPAMGELNGLRAGGTVNVHCVEGFAAGALPDSLNEIWQGSVNAGRLVNINLDQRRLYYSTDRGANFTGFPIDTVLRANDMFKIISKGGSGYTVFIVSRLQAGRFNLIACSSAFTRLQDALNAPGECGQLDVMKHYYEHSDTGRIYLPVASLDLGYKPLVPEERAKLVARLRQGGAGRRVSYTRHSNSAYLRTYAVYDLSREIRGYDLTPAVSARKPGDRRAGSSPFQREYLRLSVAALLKPDIRDLRQSRAPVPNSIDPGARTRYADTASSIAEKRAEEKDRKALSRAKQLIGSGNYEAARKMLLELRNSKSASVAAEARKQLRELEAQRDKSNVNFQTPQQQQKQQAPVEDPKKWNFDSIPNKNMK